MGGLWNNFQNLRGFPNATTSSMKRVPERSSKIISIFKEASKNLVFDFLGDKDTKKLNHQRIHRQYITL
jgi:hypothetical protein